MKVHQQPAFLLHWYPYSETSLLLEVFSHEHGKLMLMAKGARRLKPWNRGVLLPFRRLLVSWSGKGQMPILTTAEQVTYIPELKGKALNCAYYMNELIMKLLHRHDPHEALFESYQTAIHELAHGESELHTLRHFEKNLLQEIGFGLVLDHDATSGEVIDENKYYQYIPDLGPIEVEQGSAVEMVVKGKTLLDILQGNLQSKESLRESRRVIRSALDCQLNGKKLRSRNVMQQIQRFQSEVV